MKEQLQQIAERIRGMRELSDVSVEEMAATLGMKPEEYLEYEEGKRDFAFSFLYEASKKLGIDLTELVLGEVPKLSAFSLIRKGEGLPIKRRKGLDYTHLAYLFRERNSTPLYVTARFDKEMESAPLELNRHEGQEFDYILEGKLRVRIDDHEFIMEPGDSLYYNSMHPHGMVAFGGQDCTFIAVLVKE